MDGWLVMANSVTKAATLCYSWPTAPNSECARLVVAFFAVSVFSLPRMIGEAKGKRKKERKR
jgi:hypothetical protein